MDEYTDFWDEIDALEIREQQAFYKAGVLAQSVQEDLDNISFWESEQPRAWDIIYGHGYRVA